MSRRRLSIVLILAVILADRVDAQLSDVHRILDSIRVAYDLPALGAAIITPDSTIAIDVVGVRRVGDTTRATVNDRFHLGSDTKAMTAGLLGLLVDQGRLHWTSTLGSLFPELLNSMRPEYRTITVRELLSHQTGIVPNPTVEFHDGTPRRQREAFVKWVLQQPPATKRNSYAYANSNYIIAGAIAERLLNGEYETLVVDRLLRPMGITTTGFGAPGSSKAVDQPWPHLVDASGKRTAVPPGPEADNPPIFGPAGRANMTLGDWARWARVVLRASSGGASPWSDSTARALVTPAVSVDASTGYALGWLVATRPWAGPGGRVLTHAGSNTMNFAVAWLAPEGKFGVLAVTNQGGSAATRATDAAVGRLIALHR